MTERSLTKAVRLTVFRPAPYLTDREKALAGGGAPARALIECEEERKRYE